MRKDILQINKQSKVDKEKTILDITPKDIEKSYNIDSSQGTEAYFSNRYGWTLRKSIK